MNSGGSVHQFRILNSLLGNSRASFIVNIVFLIIVLYLLLALVLVPISILVLDGLDFRRLKERKKVFLEITPPATSHKSPHATAQLFTAIHGLSLSRSRLDRFLRRKRVISFELVSTRSKGIRFIVELNQNDVALFKQLVISYLPEVRFKKVGDYLGNINLDNASIMDFKQSGHFAYPLANHERLSQHDPIAYITGSMTKATTDELISYQVVLSPASRRSANRIQSKLQGGQDAGLKRSFWQYPFMIIWKLLKSVVYLFGSILELLGDEVSSMREYSTQKANFNSSVSELNHPIVESIKSKLGQPIFNVDVRTLVVSDDVNRPQGLANSLYLFHVPGYQGLKTRSSFPKSLKAKYRAMTYRLRLPSLLTRASNVLSASEVASLYHFPYGNGALTENLSKNISRTLPAPAELKKLADNSGIDVVLGINKYHGSETPIGLTEKERERHVYIIGGTGNGKTTLMQYAIVQDIRAGKGVAVIDPHGDLAETILKHIPKKRAKDVIYFNPRDIAHPIGLNLLEQPEGLSPDELLLEQDLITEAVVSVFRKIFSDDDSGGHRIEHFLRNAIHTAFTVPDATLFTVYKLLTNTAYRRSVVSKLEDEDLKDFWAGEFNKAGDYQKVKMSSGVNAKLGRFQRSVVSRRILEQPKSTINFDDIIQNKKILICNFSKGSIGEDTSMLLGVSVLAKLQLAALKRSNKTENDRTPFYLYVDEFQNFATQSFVQLLSEARKYRMFLTMAEQSTSQQVEQRLVDIILANVGTVICFRTGSPADEKLLLPLFEPYINKGEIQHLPAYNFYMRLAAMKAYEPMSGETILIDDSMSV